MEKNNDIPSTDFVGEIEIMDIKISCAVLYPESENPKRVLVQRELVGLLTGTKKGGFERYLKPKNLQNYIPDKFKNKSLSESTMSFRLKGRISQGFDATDLIDLCEMYIRAKNDDKLLKGQQSLAKAAEALILAFAKTGIIAVVDEATGYQEVRDRLALAKILDKYILDEYRKWTQTFQPEFYKEMFKLKDWPYNEKFIKRPSVIGHYTNDLVYKRLAPGVLKELRQKNPAIKRGYRKQKHHQWLTGEIGIPKLKEHLIGLIALMKAAPNWRRFLDMVNRVYPKYGDTIQMDFEDN